MGQLSLFDEIDREMLKQPSQFDGNMPSKKRVLSLFSGCGGMDLGFEGDFVC